MTTDRLSSDTPALGKVNAAREAVVPASTATSRGAAAGAAAAAPPQQQSLIRWISWGPGSSAALSIACFVLILGAVIGFEHTGQKAAAREEAPPQTAAPATQREDPALMRGDASAPAVAMPVATRSNAAPDPTVDASLARARACAAASSWSCVLDAASGVLAVQEGNPEAQSLLQRAIVQGGWATETSSITHQAANAAGGAALPVPGSHVRRHHWHTAARSKPADDDEDQDQQPNADQQPGSD